MTVRKLSIPALDNFEADEKISKLDLPRSSPSCKSFGKHPFEKRKHKKWRLGNRKIVDFHRENRKKKFAKTCMNCKW